MIRSIVPWKATRAGDITLLSAANRRLTKLIEPDRVVDYDRAAVFEPTAVRLDCIEDLHELLTDLTPRTDTCIIRGVLKREFAGRPQVLRRSRPRPGVPERFAEVARHWAMIDLEHVACPPGVDPTDPVMAGGALRRHLPPPFQVARCVAQLSSQAGLKRDHQLRGHLWFWLSRALARAELERWLGAVPGLDPSLFRCVQIHYTAAPLFEDVDDPCTDGRLVILPGLEMVTVPELPAERARVFAPADHRPYAAPRRGIGFRATRAERYMLACLRAVAGAPAGKRHPTLVAVAARLFGLAKSGGLDPADVAGRIKGAVMLSTFDRDPAEVDQALRWAWENADPWRLPR